MYLTKKTISLLFRVIFVVACFYSFPLNAAKEDNPPKGSVQMTSSELEELLIGNSWIYTDNLGGVYFDPNGKAETVWKRKKSPGEWYIEGDEVCVDVKEWGGEWCYKFYKKGKKIYTYATTKSKYVRVRVKSGNKF